MTVSLAELMRFIDYMQRLQLIVRRASVPGRDAYENDVEHSYHVAVVMIYLRSRCPGQLADFDLLKSLVLLLFHDWPEPISGDFPWGVPREEKQRLEWEAIQVIREEFPEFPELPDWLEDYWAQRSRESHAAKKVDKLSSTINILMSGGKSWHAHGQTLDFVNSRLLALLENGEPVPVVDDLIRELMRELELHPEAFPQPSAVIETQSQ